MGKKNGNNNNAQQQNNGGEKEVQKKGGSEGDSKKGGKNNSDGSIVLKIEMHCEGCASKVLKKTRAFKGVESAKADTESNKVTVTGKVDPIQIRDFLEQKTKKKVDLISPLPKKEDSNNDKNNKKEENKKSNENKPGADNKKPKEAPVTTAVIKVAFHCLGCIEKIHKIVMKTKGVHDMTIDKQKETVTVKGTMDVKALTESLKDRLKRPVEIIPPKKEKDGEKASGGGDSDKSGKKKKVDGEGQGNGGGENVIAKMEGNRMDYMMPPGFGYFPGPWPMPGYGYMGQPMPAYGNGYVVQPVPAYGNGYMGVVPPPAVPVYNYGYEYENSQVPGYPVHMKFNDENPNACSVM